MAPTKSAVRASRKLKVPIAEFLEEATRVARFADENWATTYDTKGSILRRGLDLGRDPTLTKKTGRELSELVRTATVAHTEVSLSAPPGSVAPARREATALVRRLIALCRYWADTLGDARAKQTVQQLREETRLQSGEALALALDRWARLAAEWTERLKGLAGFDEALVPAALEFAQVLREAPTKPAANAAIAARNELFRVIEERVARIRRVARFVFADDAERLRGVTSAWRRGERARQRAMPKSSQ